MNKMVEMEIALDETEWASVEATSKALGLSSIDEYFKLAINLMMQREAHNQAPFPKWDE